MLRFPRRRPVDSGEFLWLTSLSDLMILLFILFVVLYSFSAKKLKDHDFKQIVATLRNEPPPVNPIDDVRAKLSAWVEKEKLKDHIDIVKKEDALLVEIKDKVLFSSGEFRLSPQGAERLKSLSLMIEKIPAQFHLGIEGHTDDVPIHTKDVQDNWDLSAKRALNVLYALNLSDSLLKRTSIIAKGEMVPLLPNRTPQGIPLPENQNTNRRVTLKIF